jgi:hypothetical protein
VSISSAVSASLFVDAPFAGSFNLAASVSLPASV